MVFKRERKRNFKENGESYGDSHMQSESLDRKTTEEQMDMQGLKKSID